MQRHFAVTFTLLLVVCCLFAACVRVDDDNDGGSAANTETTSAYASAAAAASTDDYAGIRSVVLAEREFGQPFAMARFDLSNGRVQWYGGSPYRTYNEDLPNDGYTRRAQLTKEQTAAVRELLQEAKALTWEEEYDYADVFSDGHNSVLLTLQNGETRHTWFEVYTSHGTEISETPQQFGVLLDLGKSLTSDSAELYPEELFRVAAEGTVDFGYDISSTSCLLRYRNIPSESYTPRRYIAAEDNAFGVTLARYEFDSCTLLCAAEDSDAYKKNSILHCSCKAGRSTQRGIEIGSTWRQVEDAYGQANCELVSAEPAQTLYRIRYGQGEYCLAVTVAAETGTVSALCYTPAP